MHSTNYCLDTSRRLHTAHIMPQRLPGSRSYESSKHKHFHLCKRKVISDPFGKTPFVATKRANYVRKQTLQTGGKKKKDEENKALPSLLAAPYIYTHKIFLYINVHTYTHIYIFLLLEK